MLSKYDPMLKEHLIRLKQIACNPEASEGEEKRTENVFINIRTNYVKELLVVDIKPKRYFGIMFRGTHDISHTDQISG